MAVRSSAIRSSSVCSLNIEDIRSIAFCQVCFEPFSSSSCVPKLLPCGHTFCQTCITSLSNNRIYTCRCPKCRFTFVLRYDTVFPTNYTLMEVLTHLQQTMTLTADAEGPGSRAVMNGNGTGTAGTATTTAGGPRGVLQPAVNTGNSLCAAGSSGSAPALASSSSAVHTESSAHRHLKKLSSRIPRSTARISQFLSRITRGRKRVHLTRSSPSRLSEVEDPPFTSTPDASDDEAGVDFGSVDFREDDIDEYDDGMEPFPELGGPTLSFDAVRVLSINLQRNPAISNPSTGVRSNHSSNSTSAQCTSSGDNTSPARDPQVEEVESEAEDDGHSLEHSQDDSSGEMPPSTATRQVPTVVDEGVNTDAIEVPTSKTLKWPVMFALEVVMILTLIFWGSVVGRLLYAEYSREPDESPSVLCTGLRTLDNWLGVDISRRTAHCQRATTQTPFVDRMSAEAELLVNEFLAAFTKVFCFLNDYLRYIFENISEKVSPFLSEMVEIFLENANSVYVVVSGWLLYVYEYISEYYFAMFPQTVVDPDLYED